MMNISKTVAAATIAVSLLSSCGKKAPAGPHFPREETRKVEFISEDLPFHRGINTFRKYGDYFIIVSLDAQDNWISILDDRGNIVRSGLKMGRGPSEVLHPFVHIDSVNGIVYIFDANGGNTLALDIDAFIDGDSGAIKPIVLPDNGYREKADLAMYLGDGSWFEHFGYYLRRDTSAVKRLSVFNADGKLINGINNFPSSDRSALCYLTIIGYTNMTLSPSRRKLAIGYEYGIVLETYSLSPDRGIESMATKRYIDPGYEGAVNNQENRPTTLCGFGQMDSSEDEIYTILDGKNTLQDYFDGPDSYLNSIAVFDWNAEPLRRFNTDCTLGGISVDGNTAYVLAIDDMGLYFLGKVDIE